MTNIYIFLLRKLFDKIISFDKNRINRKNNNNNKIRDLSGKGKVVVL